MAIGGVSSISMPTVRFRRPRGVKGPVSDTFHKIGQIDVKTRQLNRVLNTIDSSINIIASIHTKMAAGNLSEGLVGWDGFREQAKKGLGEAAGEIGGGVKDVLKGDLDGYKRIRTTISKASGLAHELIEGGSFLNKNLEKSFMEISREINNPSYMRLRQNKKMESALLDPPSEKYAQASGKIRQVAGGTADIRKAMEVNPRLTDPAHRLRYAQGISQDLEKQTQKFSSVYKQLLNMKNDEFVLGKPTKRYLADFSDEIHNSLTEMQRVSVELKKMENQGGATAEEIEQAFSQIDMKKITFLFEKLGDRMLSLSEYSKHMEGKMREDLNKVQPEIKQTENKVDDLGDALEKSGNDADKLNKSLRKVNSSVDDRPGLGAGSGYVGLAGGIGGMGPVAAMSSMYASFLPYFAGQALVEFSKQMGVIKAETLGQGVDQTELRNSILGISGTTRFTASDVANTIVSAVRSGFKVREDLSGIKHLTTLAVAEGVDLGTAYGSVEPILNTLGIQLKDLVPVMDKLSAATSSGATNLQELGWIAGKALSTHLESGGSFDEFFAMASALRSLGKGREVTGTALKRMQLRYSMLAAGSGTKGQREALAAAGMSSKDLYDESGKLKSTMEITKAIHEGFKKTGANTAQEVTKLFGEEVGPTTISLFSDKGIERVEKALEKIGTSQGSTEQKSKAQEGSIFHQVQNLRSALEAVTLRLFGTDESHFAELLGRIVTKIQDFAVFLEKNSDHIHGFFNRLTQWFDTNSDKIIRFFSTMGKSLLDVSKFFAGVVSFITSFMLNFQGLVAIWLKLFVYVKVTKFLFGGIFSFFFKWFKNLFFGLNILSVGMAVWTNYLVDLGPLLLTSNKKLQAFLRNIVKIATETEVFNKVLRTVNWVVPGFVVDKNAWKKVLAFIKEKASQGLFPIFGMIFGRFSRNFKMIFTETPIGKILRNTFRRMSIEFQILVGQMSDFFFNFSGNVQRRMKLMLTEFIYSIRHPSEAIRSTQTFMKSGYNSLAIIASNSFDVITKKSRQSFNAMLPLALSFGSELIGVFRNPGKAIKRFYGWLILLFASLKKATFLVWMKVFFIHLAKLLTSFTALKAGVISMFTGFAALSAPFTAAVITAVAIIIGGISLIIRNFGKVKQTIVSVWNFIKALFGFIVTSIKFLFFNIDKMVPQIRQFFRIIGFAFKWVWGLFKSIGSWIENVFVKFLDILINAFDTMTNLLKGVTDAMNSIMGKDKEVFVHDQSTVRIGNPVDEKVFDRKDIEGGSVDGLPKSGQIAPAQSSIQFVNFKKVDDLVTTLESGFTSLVDVNSRILDVISGGKGELVANTQDKTITSNIKKPSETVKVDVNTQDIKMSPEMPNINVNTQDKTITSNIKKPSETVKVDVNTQDIKMSPEMPNINVNTQDKIITPDIKIPSEMPNIGVTNEQDKTIPSGVKTTSELSKVDANTPDIRILSEVPGIIVNTKNQTITPDIKMPSEMPRIDVPSVPNSSSETQNTPVVQNITLNINDAGDLDVEDLTRRIKEELAKEMSQNQFGR